MGVPYRYSATNTDQVIVALVDMGKPSKAYDIRKELEKRKVGLHGRNQIYTVLSKLKKEGIAYNNLGSWILQESDKARKRASEALDKVSLYEPQPEQPVRVSYPVPAPSVAVPSVLKQANSWEERYDSLLKEYQELARLLAGKRAE